MTRAIRRLAVAGLPVLVAAVMAAPVSAAAQPATAGGSQPAGVSALAATNTPAGVLPASAPADCPSGDLCFWVDAGYIGKMGMFSGNNGNWGDFSQSQCSGGTWNDCASAIYSHGSVDNARVFKDINGGGGGACLPRGTLWSNLTSHYFDNGVNMNDQISSNDWISSACP